MSDHLPSAGRIMSLLALAGSVGVLALIGYFFGDSIPKPKKGSQQHGHDVPGLGMDDEDEEYNPYEEPSEKQEKLLSYNLSRMIKFVEQGNFAAALGLVAKCTQYVEKVWGPDSIQYALTMFPVAKVYSEMKQLEMEKNALTQAANIFKKTQPLAPLEGHAGAVYEKLVQIHLHLSEYDKAEEWAMVAYTMRRDARLKSNSPLYVEPFCDAALTAAMVCSNLGKFKRAEEFYKEALDCVITTPTLRDKGYSVIEFYTNCLHQQGKTDQALEEIRTYLSRPEADPNDPRPHQRLSTLYFTIDKFEEAEQTLQQAIKLEKQTTGLTPQTLCDMANINWELGNEEKARELQKDIKSMPGLGHTPPYSRSKYLSTVSALIENGYYNLTMRVNRTRPMRKEGDILEKTKDMPRKLKSCFLEVSFEVPNQAPCVITQEVTEPHEFHIKSPQLPLEPGKWYEVSIDIYTDDTKTEKIGSHHQMIFALPSMERKLMF